MLPEIRITNLYQSQDEGVSRIGANVEGMPVWFDSEDVRLQPAPEGFAGIFLIPAMAQGTNLFIEAPLSPHWRTNASKLMSIFEKWWGYPPVAIREMEGESNWGAQRAETALCFTGGVDSFYCLLRGQHPIDYLVFAHGYDIPLGDTDRMKLFEPSLRAISDETGTRPVVIRTNLREDPTFRSIPWSRSHGAALAALGHFMGNAARLIIAASYPYEFNRPWGSHWEIDPLWSSEVLEVVHSGAGKWRSDKLQMIADEPLVRRHLRVCWENRDVNLNCCQCEKCLRTMLILEECGKLDDFKSFPETSKIPAFLDNLPYLSSDLTVVYQTFLDKGLNPDIEKALRSLLWRSRNKWMTNVWQYIWRYLVSLRKRIKSLLRRRPV